MPKKTNLKISKIEKWIKNMFAPEIEEIFGEITNISQTRVGGDTPISLIDIKTREGPQSYGIYGHLHPFEKGDYLSLQIGKKYIATNIERVFNENEEGVSECSIVSENWKEILHYKILDKEKEEEKYKSL